MEYDEEIDKVYAPKEMKEFYKNLEAYDKKYLREQAKVKKVIKEWTEMSHEEKVLFSAGEGEITHVSFSKGGSIQELNGFEE